MEKFLKKLQEIHGKFSQENHTEQSPIPTIKLPLIPRLFNAYFIFFDNVKKFLLLGTVFAILLSIIALSSGQLYMCKYPDFYGYCNNNSLVYGIVHLLNFFLITVFASRWYHYCFLQQKLSYTFIFRLTKHDMKVFGAALFFFALNLLPLISLYLLYVRVPNPDWRIEITYFAVVSVGFIVPFILMRFYSFPAFILAGEKLPSIKEVWAKTSGNTFRIIVSVSLLVLISGMVLLSVYSNFKLVAAENTFYINTMVQLIYELVYFAIVMFWVNYFYTQKIYLFEKVNDNGK